MEYHHIRSLLLISLFSGCSISALYSQNSSENIYNSFDAVIGYQNLDSNNGLVHLNNDRTDNKTHRYYNNQYLTGDFSYDGQPFFANNLKYDLSKDILVVKVHGESSVGIELATEKTASFSIDGRQFVHLNQDRSLPSFIKGYYEWISFNPRFQLYIKHKKDAYELVKSNGKFTNYESNQSFLVCLQNTYHQVGSQNDYTALFPNQKQQIDTFYQNNRDIRKNDPKQFMRNLAAFTESLISKDLK